MHVEYKGTAMTLHLKRKMIDFYNYCLLHFFEKIP